MFSLPINLIPKFSCIFLISMCRDSKEERIVLSLVELLEGKLLFLNKHLSTNEICSAIGCNPRLLPKLVKRRFGVSINSLINQYRVRYSIDLIESGYLSNLTVESLADHVGFRSRNTFYLAFKNETGLSPTIFDESLVDIESLKLFQK